jgi:transposase
MRLAARNCIERCFSKLKRFRRFATRYDRRTTHFLGFVHLAAAVMAALNVDAP